MSTDIAALKDDAQKRQLGWRGREPGQDGPHMQVLPSDILTLIERIEEAENGQRCLAEAIRNAAVRAGILRESAALTGPMLMLLCDDLASMTKQDRCAVNHHNRCTTVVVPGLDEAERSALARFNETINDDGTYDISKAMIHRLADKGAVRHLSAGKYQITQAGCAMLGEFPIEVGQSQAGGK